MNQQRGGTLIGFIVGVIVGLGAALAVAVYVTKVPVPFMNKSQSRSAEQDEAEALKNKNWDPNAPLYGKNPAKPAAADGPVATADAAASAPIAKAVPTVRGAEKSDSKPETKADTKADAKAEVKPAVAADPLGDLAKAKLAASEPFYYFVQVGAYRNSEDAEAQRAKLSLSGVVSKISEREQSGQIVFRVRVGPFDKKDEAEKSKEKLDASGLETALVRVQRQ
ncbi:MAG: sporulation protein [Burkholderiales bacterium PBB4]|nr:MAG: sporulation protein [Burkholderiales bacterium PBB4]